MGKGIRGINVTYKEKPLHKDTDLGRFSIEIMKVLVSKNYDPVTGPCNSYEDLASIATYASKSLIEALDKEAGNG